MSKKSTKIRNRVYLECSESSRKVKSWLVSKTDNSITIKTPTGAILELTKRTGNVYVLLSGTLEFTSDGFLYP